MSYPEIITYVTCKYLNPGKQVKICSVQEGEEGGAIPAFLLLRDLTKKERNVKNGLVFD